jgi:hypothetical protein
VGDRPLASLATSRKHPNTPAPAIPPTPINNLDRRRFIAGIPRCVGSTSRVVAHPNFTTLHTPYIPHPKRQLWLTKLTEFPILLIGSVGFLQVEIFGGNPSVRREKLLSITTYSMAQLGPRNGKITQKDARNLRRRPS